ncbi:MAG TPA: hypothetical protein VGA36_11430 [Nitriliruptorales bacterium]
MADKDSTPRIITRGAGGSGGSGGSEDGFKMRLVPRLGAAESRYGERKARWTIDPLQLIAVAVVVVLLVHALALLLRAGFDTFDWFEPHVEVAGLHGTRLTAIIEAFLGLVVLYTVVGIVDQTGLRIIGFLMAIAGAVILIEPDSLHEWVGLHEDNGAVALVVGVALAVGSMTPVLNIYPKPPPMGRAPWDR